MRIVNQMAFNGNLGIGMPNNTSAGAKLEVNGIAGGSSVIGLFRDSIAGDTLFQINNNKTIRAKGLAGTGTRMVMASPTGCSLQLILQDCGWVLVSSYKCWWFRTECCDWQNLIRGYNRRTVILYFDQSIGVTFPRINANNTVSALSASDF